MPNVIIDASEVTALAGALAATGAAIDVESSVSVRAAAEATEARARTMAPVRTGRLRESISSDHDGTEATVTADADYAVYVEFGTSNMAPQPFMFPAGDFGERVLEELSENDVNPFR